MCLHCVVLLLFRFGDIGVASYCINVSDSLCVNIVPFLVLFVLIYLFRVFSLFDLDKDLGGSSCGGYGGGSGGGGGGLFGGLGGLGDIFGGIGGGLTGIFK